MQRNKRPPKEIKKYLVWVRYKRGTKMCSKFNYFTKQNLAREWAAEQSGKAFLFALDFDYLGRLDEI